MNAALLKQKILLKFYVKQNIIGSGSSMVNSLYQKPLALCPSLVDCITFA